MRIEVNQVKKGQAVEFDNGIYYVIERDHFKPGKGGAIVRLKLRDIKTGNVIDRTLRSGEKIEALYIEKKKLQFLYSSGTLYEFMDNQTFEQISIPEERLGDVINYLKENIELEAVVYEGAVIAIEPPLFVEMKITKTEPGIRGDTSKAGTKPAVTETGMTVQVPLFVNEGDMIKIDTRTNEYIGRA